MCGAWKCPSAELLMPLPKQNERENSEKAGFAVIAYSKHLYLAGATIFFVPINIYTSTVFKDLHSQLGNNILK